MERDNEMTLNQRTALSQWSDGRLAALRPDSEWEPSLTRGLALLRTRRHAQQARGRKYVWLAAGGVATCVPLIAMPATRAFAQRCVSACVSESSWVRDFLTGNMPGPSTVYVQPEDRVMAPDFTLNDASGNPVTLSALRGKVVLLNFWATWCAPCKIEMPWFVELQDSRKSAGLEVLGVALDDDGWKSVKPYVEARNVNYPVVVGNQEITGLYGGVPSLPTTLIIDRSGRIAAVHVGLCSKSEYEGDVRAVLGEK
jgi:peroxiredoxin